MFVHFTQFSGQSVSSFHFHFIKNNRHKNGNFVWQSASIPKVVLGKNHLHTQCNDISVQPLKYNITQGFHKCRWHKKGRWLKRDLQSTKKRTESISEWHCTRSILTHWHLQSWEGKQVWWLVGCLEDPVLIATLSPAWTALLLVLNTENQSLFF